MTQETGELIETRGEVSFEWRVDNIKLKNEEEEKEYTSPVFSFSDACWCLGITQTNNQRCRTIYVFLRREDWGPPISVICTFRYKISSRSESYLCNDFSHVFPNDNENRMKLDLPCSNPSAIICTLKSGDRYPIEVSLFQRLWNTSLSLKSILAESKGSDLILKLKRRKQPVHRMILESRFPGFASKLDKEMEKSQTGKLNIGQDEEDAFATVLYYVYSGEPEGLSSENVCSVYRIALKYDLKKLRKLCTVFLEKNLSVDGVCDVIAMANLYGEKLLKERAKEFFAKNASKILKTENWESFKREKSSLFLDLLECMMEGNA